MIRNYRVLDLLIVFWLKLLNSAVLVGLYYGFLTIFSIGPSYLFLIRTRILNEERETKISATTGFITGQLMLFISIYYAPMHLALTRPHTLTVLTLPYLFFNFVQKNNKKYLGWGYKLDYGYKNPNSIRNFTIYKVFLNNLFFQLLNPILLPSSLLIRLINLNLFRSNNKLVFLTSSFVGWLIGHILTMKCIGLVFVWLQQKNSIKSKITLRFDKYTLLQLRNYAGQIFVVLSFVIFAHYLGRIPLPYYFIEEMKEYDEKDMEASENEETNEEDISVYFSGKKEKTDTDTDTDNDTDIEKKQPLEKSLVTTLFDYKKWNRPLRYIKNDHFERVVKDENSQFFFQVCQSDGKKRISFTYPPNLSNFLKMMDKKMDLFRRDKTSYNNNELSNYWSSINKEKTNKLSNEVFERAKMIDKKYNQFCPDVLENRIRLSDDNSKTKYLTQKYDPLLNGRVRGESQKKKSFSPLTTNETDTTNYISINKIHGLLLSMEGDYPEFEEKIDEVDRNLLLTEIGFFFNLLSKFSEKSVSSFNFDGLYLFPEHKEVKIYSEEKERKRNFLFDAIQTDPTNNSIFNRKLCSEINEISKEVPRWSYKLIDDLDVLMDGNPDDAQILGPKAERIVLFSQKDSLSSTKKIEKTNDNQNITDDNKKNITGADPETEFAVTYYSREPDFNRELIKGSMAPQRRKTATLKLFQASVHSPIFIEVIDNYHPLFFIFGDLFYDISQYLKEYFRKPGTDNSEFLRFQKEIEEKEEEENKDESESRLKQIEEAWESILYGLIIRSFVLLFQSIFRKYILLPSLIITKNIIRILLFQNPEWSEDLKDWRKEVHIKCTYQGIPVPNNTLPTNWFWEGLQIRILFPFVLKPWHNKVRSTEKKNRPTEKKPRSTEKKKKNLWFLTGYGTQVESYVDDHVPNPFLFLGPILKKIKKQLKKDLKNRFFLVMKVFNERKKESRIVLEEKKIDEFSESKKNSTISNSNPMIEESPVIIESIYSTNSSFTEKRLKEIHVQTKTILKEIEKITEEKKEGVITSDAKRFELQKNSLKILKRRTVRLIRKSYCFFKIFKARIYLNYLLECDERELNPRPVRAYIDLAKLRFIYTIYNKIYISNKKNKQRVDTINQSIIPFMSTIDKFGNIRDMNSQNSCDVSSLSQAYVLFKLSQMQVSNGYKYKLRSILESPGRSLSLMNQWTNWLKVHYQYALPESVWSRLAPQKWRNRIHEHRVAQKKDLVEYDSCEKKPLIFNNKQQMDLLQKKKIKKQYGYDLFSYQHLNYVDTKKSDIYEYKSPLQANKNQTISYNYNIPKNTNELFDIMGNSLLQNYIAEDGIEDINIEMFMEMERKKQQDRKVDKKYFKCTGMNVERKKNSITYKKLFTPILGGLFSKLSAYKKNPWILPINFFFVPFYGNKNITDRVELALEKKEYASQADLKSYLANYYRNSRYNINKYRTDLKGERNFLLDKYFGFSLYCPSPVEDTIMDNLNVYCLLLRLKTVKKFVIMSIKKGDLDFENLVRLTIKDTCYTECRDTEELRDQLMFFIEPTRISRNNYEQLFIYQTISISLRHKKRTETKHKNNYDLLVPENLLSTRRRRELRILICLNPQNRNTVDRNTRNSNEKKINNSAQVLTKNEDLDSDTKKLKKLKFFLWPNYRFEDLACMNRYWFDTHNGSRFSILRLHMYPRLKT